MLLRLFHATLLPNILVSQELSLVRKDGILAVNPTERRLFLTVAIVIQVLGDLFDEIVHALLHLRFVGETSALQLAGHISEDVRPVLLALEVLALVLFLQALGNETLQNHVLLFRCHRVLSVRGCGFFVFVESRVLATRRSSCLLALVTGLALLSLLKSALLGRYVLFLLLPFD